VRDARDEETRLEKVARASNEGALQRAGGRVYRQGQAVTDLEVGRGEERGSRAAPARETDKGERRGRERRATETDAFLGRVVYKGYWES